MHLIVINRENGKIEANIKDRKQYDIWRNYLLHTNDVQMGIKVFTEELGLTRERVRQIKEKAIKKLGEGKRTKVLRTYLG